MDDDTFGRLLDFRISQIKSVLEAKKVEYARASRMHNFERAAEILRCSKERALLGIAVKHFVSVLDIVDEIGTKSVRLEFWNEKIGDAINYLVLLDVMVREGL